MKKLSILLLIAFIACPFAPARAGQADKFVNQLTKENIAAFLEKMRVMTSSQSAHAFTDDVKTYFDNHLAEKGSFKSQTRFEIPGYPVQEGEMKLDKKSFIAQVTENQNLLSDYQTSVEITELDISRSGKSARLVTEITESGKLPWPGENGEEERIPVKGTSHCEQKLIVSLTGYIQLAQADCQTLIKFQPFAGRALGE